MAKSITRGTIYLLHYTKRTSRGRQHYLGWSENPQRRLRQHRRGHGAVDTRIAVAEGAKLMMVQTWSGTQVLESRIKDWSREHRAGFAGLCPICDGRVKLPPDLQAEIGSGSPVRISQPAA